MKWQTIAQLALDLLEGNSHQFSTIRATPPPRSISSKDEGVAYGYEQPPNESNSTYFEYRKPTPAYGLTMPPRVSIIEMRALPYGFDMPEHERVRMQYRVPAKHMYEVAQQNGHARPEGTQRRSRWEAEHENYLYELMELAMRLLNRPVEHRDFIALTEALNRRFRGTMISGNPYPERGVNAIHSKAMKSDKYNDLVRRILPDQSQSFVPMGHRRIQPQEAKDGIVKR
jgi:hypothetical protein